MPRSEHYRRFPPSFALSQQRWIRVKDALHSVCAKEGCLLFRLRATDGRPILKPPWRFYERQFFAHSRPAPRTALRSGPWSTRSEQPQAKKAAAQTFAETETPARACDPAGR